MFILIDKILNKITMYRLMIYVLALLLIVAFVLSCFGLLPFGPIPLVYSSLFLLGVCWLSNLGFSALFRAPSNVESVYITALILALIVAPAQPAHLVSYFGFATLVAVLAMGSKYLLAIHKKHLFNPAALAVALTAILFHQAASWWVGTALMLPLVLLAGLFVVRKLRRSDLVFSFLAVALATIATTSSAFSFHSILTIWKLFLVDSPLLFFSFIMLTEPMTTPPQKSLRLVYGALVAIMFLPTAHIGSVYFTPELALLFGNVFSYLVSPKQKLILFLQEKSQIAKDVYEFVFTANQKFWFKAGQYLEWTLIYPGSPDARGYRRYFTIASAPTEREIRLGVKFYPNASRFKRAMLDLGPGATLTASQLAGEFTLPKDSQQKLVFIAGGIGITPFRSMVQYLLDAKQSRDITLLYSNNQAEEIAYREVFEQAAKQFNMKTIYALTDLANIPAAWSGHKGLIDAQLIISALPDYKERLFYISGPHSMVTAFQKVLQEIGIKKSRIKIDFFPGFV